MGNNQRCDDSQVDHLFQMHAASMRRRERLDQQITEQDETFQALLARMEELGGQLTCAQEQANPWHEQTSGNAGENVHEAEEPVAPKNGTIVEMAGIEVIAADNTAMRMTAMGRLQAPVIA